MDPLGGSGLFASECYLCVSTYESFLPEENPISVGMNFIANAKTSLTTLIQDDPFIDWPDLR